MVRMANKLALIFIYSKKGFFMLVLFDLIRDDISTCYSTVCVYVDL